MVLIDLSKAFDSICHRTLFLTLQGLGASELKRRSGLRATLPTVVQSTRLGTSRSEELIFTHGVPKGPF